MMAKAARSEGTAVAPVDCEDLADFLDLALELAVFELPPLSNISDLSP